MTEFRGLPVWRGDAFLIRGNRGTYLFDGGDLSGELDRMLRERRVGNVRAAVCTFPSPDRLGGILDIMAAGYPLRECWLPARLGVLEAMAGGFNRDWGGWFSLFGRTTPPEFTGIPETEQPWGGGAMTLLRLAAAGCPDKPLTVPVATGNPAKFAAALLHELARQHGPYRGKPGATLAIQELGRKLYRAHGYRELSALCCTLLLEKAARYATEDPRAKAVRGLVLAAMTAILAKNGPPVRFFRHTRTLQNSLIARHPIACLNGVETDPAVLVHKQATPQALFREAGKLFSKGRGLVFQYGDGECGALFCGNSALRFTGPAGGIHLIRPTVITVPGHGGVVLEDAYAHIRSASPEKDVWVRGHYSHARKVSETYRRLPNRLCLNNPVSRSMQEVVLEFGQGSWQRVAGQFTTCD